MKKKLLSAVCALVLVFGSAAALPEGFAKIDSAITASAETYGDYEYQVLDDGTVEISKYRGSDEEVNIPSAIDGKKVTSIGDYAFSNCSSLTSVTIPDSVTSIDSGAFGGCKSLTSVTIPDSVTSIGRDAFAYCTSLTSVTISNSVSSISMATFLCCSNLTSITIPKSVTSIGQIAFGYDFDNGFVKIENFIIYGYKGSAAETYANEKGFTFVDIESIPAHKKGDLNDNGKIDAADLLAVKSHIKKVSTLEGDKFKAADIDDNGVINAADLLKMKAHMKGVTLLWE